MKFEKAQCPSCGAQIEVDATRQKLFCQYCGNQFLVNEAIKKSKSDVVINNKALFIKNSNSSGISEFLSNINERTEKQNRFLKKYWPECVGAYIGFMWGVFWSITSEKIICLPIAVVVSVIGTRIGVYYINKLLKHFRDEE